MTGVSFRIEIDDQVARRAFKGMEAAGRDLFPAMDAIGAALVASTQIRFERGEGPDGKAWIPSIRVRETGGLTLVESGRLAASITHAAARDSVEIGTNVIYAGIHQLGGDIVAKNAPFLVFNIPGVGFRKVKKVTIPARPFLGVDEADETEIGNIMADHLLGDVP